MNCHFALSFVYSTCNRRLMSSKQSILEILEANALCIERQDPIIEEKKAYASSSLSMCSIIKTLIPEPSAARALWIVKLLLNHSYQQPEHWRNHDSIEFKAAGPATHPVRSKHRMSHLRQPASAIDIHSFPFLYPHLSLAALVHILCILFTPLPPAMCLACLYTTLHIPVPRNQNLLLY
ncbi:hypothetical protein CPB85DRAFT_1457695 [Mucidula mucida]|nr:hypothetical protein CPB85DRAFT_1457695 [Mucidula mucida]